MCGRITTVTLLKDSNSSRPLGPGESSLNIIRMKGPALQLQSVCGLGDEEAF